MITSYMHSSGYWLKAFKDNNFKVTIREGHEGYYCQGKFKSLNNEMDVMAFYGPRKKQFKYTR